jgi:hypothetical protein
MHFLHPFFLPFALVGALPILVHLIGRPQARVRKFAALELLARSQRQTSRWLRLRERLLLVARTLAMIAIPVLLARPYLEHSSPLGYYSGRQSAVLILDDSLSMSYQAGLMGHQTHFDRAKSQTRDLLEGMAGSEVALLRGSKGSSAAIPELTQDLSEVRHALGTLEPTYRTSDLAAALSQALQILSSATIEDRRVYIFSDFAQKDLAGIAVPDGIGLIPIDVAERSVLENHAVTKLELTQVDARTVDVAVEVCNFSDKPLKDFPVTLRREGEVIAQGLIDVAARQSATKHFTQVLGEDRGLAAFSAEIEPDRLPLDDRRYAALSTEGSLRVLILDGDLRAVRRESGSFFLETALKTGRPGTPMEVTVAQPDEAPKLADFDVVFVSDVKTPPTGLASFVRNGGGLFVAVGPQVDEDAYNATGILPLPLASNKRSSVLDISVEHNDWGLELGPTVVGQADRFALYRPGHRAEVLMRLSDGTPLLTGAREVGKGRVLLFGSSLDNEWNDFPLQPTFLPFATSVTALLANRSAAPPTDVEPGQPRRVPADAEVKPPTGRRVSPGDLFRATDVPGLYRTYVAQKERADQSFVVNPSPQESDLSRPEALQTLAKQSGKSGSAATQAPLWHSIATLLLLLLLLESAIAAYSSRAAS